MVNHIETTEPVQVETVQVFTSEFIACIYAAKITAPALKFMGTQLAGIFMNEIPGAMLGAMVTELIRLECRADNQRLLRTQPAL